MQALLSLPQKSSNGMSGTILEWINVPRRITYGPGPSFISPETHDLVPRSVAEGSQAPTYLLGPGRNVRDQEYTMHAIDYSATQWTGINFIPDCVQYCTPDAAIIFAEAGVPPMRRRLLVRRPEEALESLARQLASYFKVDFMSPVYELVTPSVDSAGQASSLAAYPFRVPAPVVDVPYCCLSPRLWENGADFYGTFSNFPLVRASTNCDAVSITVGYEAMTHFDYKHGAPLARVCVFEDGSVDLAEFDEHFILDTEVPPGAARSIFPGQIIAIVCTPDDDDGVLMLCVELRRTWQQRGVKRASAEA